MKKILIFLFTILSLSIFGQGIKPSTLISVQNPDTFFTTDLGALKSTMMNHNTFFCDSKFEFDFTYFRPIVKRNGNVVLDKSSAVASNERIYVELEDTITMNFYMAGFTFEKVNLTALNETTNVWDVIGSVNSTVFEGFSIPIINSIFLANPVQSYSYRLEGYCDINSTTPSYTSDPVFFELKQNLNNPINCIKRTNTAGIIAESAPNNKCPKLLIDTVLVKIFIFDGANWVVTNPTATTTNTLNRIDNILESNVNGTIDTTDITTYHDNTITGNGTINDPFSVVQPDAIVVDGTTITGNGTTASPFVSLPEDAANTESNPISASATQVAVPSTNVQGAIFDLSASLKNVETTASNGLSKNFKNFELGQSVGAAGNPGALTSNREIPTNNFQLIVYGKQGFQSRTANNDYRNFIGGYNNFYSNTTGLGNTGNGYNNFFNNTTGNYDTGNGYNNFYSNTTGLGNTGNGINNFYSNTTGNYNTGIGYNNFYPNTTGNYNTGSGYHNFFNNTTGLGNTGNGINNFYNNTTGNYNTGIGYNNAAAQTSGDNNIAIGVNCNLLNATGSNQINIGNTFYKSINNSVGIFNNNPTVTLDINGTDAIKIPIGTTAQRPIIAVNGMSRYNSTFNKFEWYENGTWVTKQNSSRIWVKGINGTSANIAANTAINLLTAGDVGSDTFVAADFTTLPTIKEIDVWVNGVKAYRTTGVLATSAGTVYSITTGGLLTVNVLINQLEIQYNK